MIVLSTLLSLAGFLALCLAMPRHHHALLGGQPSIGRRRVLRAVGWLALALSGAASVKAWGLAYGVVGGLGLLTPAAAAVLLTLTYWRRASASRRPKS